MTFGAPLAPAHWVAGLPVIGFRAFALFGLLVALRAWWRERHHRPEHNA